MTRAATFSDAYGKKGKIGALVYPRTLDYGRDTTDEERRAKAKRVTAIWTQGAAGTKIQLEGERVGSPAKAYCILEQPPESDAWETPKLYE
jgi:hypothetical protein